MKPEQLRALRNELKQLNVELSRFKEELLTARVEELERIARARVRKPHLRLSREQPLT